MYFPPRGCACRKRKSAKQTGKLAMEQYAVRLREKRMVMSNLYFFL